MKVPRGVFIDVLHLFALVSFAVAQPLYDLLGPHPEFFVSHKATPGLIIGLIGTLSIGLALVLVLGEVGAWFIGDRVRRSVHWGFVFVLSMLTILPPAQRVIEGTDLLIIGLALLVGIFFTISYIRWEAIRLFVTVLTPAVVAFPLWFLVVTPSGGLVLPDTVVAPADIEIENPVPVVLVVLDEFNVTALLDSTGRIDPIRFPNFAALTAESWWFPNAVATSGSTERAVPAILTGLQPQPDVSVSPTANEYPRNLFVMLGKEYHLNGFESLTALCPDAWCRNENADPPSPDYITFFSDVAVIYLHIITPSRLKRALPSLDAQWRNFGRIIMADHHSPAVGNDVERPPSVNSRDLRLNSFLSQIVKSPSRALHFLHVLLPHVTYEYLASGHKYFPSEGGTFPSGIVNEAVGWIGEDPLILTAYYQYLQQIGYLDRFLGRLKKTLEITRLYQKALIIVTADHGVAFQPGLSRRGVQSGNATEILKVPMFVKLPGQREGVISERLVSGIDVLPTIADVLGVKDLWDMDGRSMVSDEHPLRTEIEIPGVGIFKAKEFEGFFRLEWQVDHFGMHSSLDRLVPKGPYPSLIGEKISKVPIGPSSPLRFHSGDLKYLEHVNPASGFLPALFRAYIEGTESRNFPIAIALNGQIWSTTTTSEWDGKSNFFSVLLPPAAFEEGKNAINVYRIEQAGRKLLPIISNYERPTITFHYDRSNQMQLVYSDGREIPVQVDRNFLHGNLDSVRVLGNMLVFTGWGADVAAGQPAAEGLIFSGTHLVARVALDSRREDVVDANKDHRLLHSGFNAIVPLDVFKSSANEIRVVLVSEGDKTLGLSFSDEQKNIIKASLEKDALGQ